MKRTLSLFSMLALFLMTSLSSEARFVGNNSINNFDYLGLNFKDNGVKMVDSFNIDGSYGVTQSEIRVHLTCKCNTGGTADKADDTWFFDVVKMEGSATGYVPRKGTRYKHGNRRNTTEKYDYLQKHIDHTVAHEQLHIDHYKEGFEKKIEGFMFAAFLAYNDMETEAKCEEIARTVLKELKRRWSVIHKAELNHTHEDFAHEHDAPNIWDRAGIKREKGWIYGTGDGGGGAFQVPANVKEFKYIKPE